MRLPLMTLIEQDETGLKHWKARLPTGKAYFVLTLEHGTVVRVQSWVRRREIRSAPTLAAIRAALAQK